MKDPGVGIAVGVRGYGKTTLLRQIISESPRVIVVDPMDQVESDAWLYGSRGGIIFDGANPTPGTLPISAPFFVRVPVMYGKKQRTVHEAAKLALQARECLLAIDEADTWLGPNTNPTLLQFAIHCGRHYDVGIMVTARRAAHLPRLLTSQADRLYYFRTSEPRDMAYLRERTGTVPRGIATLPVGSHYRFDGAGKWTLVHGKLSGKSRRSAPEIEAETDTMDSETGE